MLQAYLRGYLKSEFSNGLKSRIREEVIFQALDIEGLANQSAAALNVKIGTISPHLDEKKVQDVLRDNQQLVERIERLRGFNLSDPAEEVEGMFKDVVLLYNKLDASGLLEKLGMDDKLRKMIAEQQQED